VGRKPPSKCCEERVSPVIGKRKSLCIVPRHATSRAVCRRKAVNRQGPRRNAVGRPGQQPACKSPAIIANRARLRDRAPAALQRRPTSPCKSDQTDHGLLWQAHGQQTAARYISKFEFPYILHGQQCQFVMMAVVGHLQNTEFGDRYRHDLLRAAAMSALLRLPAHCSISCPFKLNT
jgi:hypothetical protein